jgi:hypothetical protein
MIYVWRIDDLDEILAWAHENRLFRELSCVEQAEFSITELATCS